MKKLLLLVAFLLPGISTAGVCTNASIAGAYIVTGVTGQRVGSITTPFSDVGRFVFSGLGGNGVGAVTYSGQEIRNNGSRYAIAGSGSYTVTATCAVTVALNWSVSGIVVPGVTYNLYASDMNTVPATNVIYSLDGIETTSFLATNPITFTAGIKSGVWSFKRVNR